MGGGRYTDATSTSMEGYVKKLRETQSVQDPCWISHFDSRERGRDSLSRESDSLSRESLGPFETLGPDGHWAPFKLSRESLNKFKLGKDRIGRTRITDPPET